MTQLCSQDNTEDSALILSVLNGINGSVFKKGFLYSCSSINEFKQKLKIYEKLRNDS